jgi:hypothetical protein
MNVQAKDIRTLADLVRFRFEGNDYIDRADVLWDALMVCHDCDHRMIDHDMVADRCTLCRCDQSQRGLSCHADARLTELGRAIRDVIGAPR